MTTYDIKHEVDLLRHVTPITFYDTPKPTIYSCTVYPAKKWDKATLETRLQVTIPFEMEQLWTEASHLELYKDETYGQWGIIIWDAERVLTRQEYVKSSRLHDFLSGDLAIGEFRGDSDIILIRCDPTQPDFGVIIIADPIMRREYWATAAECLSMFLHQLRESDGDKYWGG
jgi:hypothetical protein